MKIKYLFAAILLTHSVYAGSIPVKHCSSDPFAPCHLTTKGHTFYLRDISLMSYFKDFGHFLEKNKLDIGYFIHDFSMGEKTAFSLLKRYRMVGIFKENELIGICGVHQEGYMRKLVDFSTYIVPKWRGLGLGSATKEELLRLFKVHKSVDNVRALIHKHNVPSEKSIKKLGFENRFNVYQKDL